MDENDFEAATRDDTRIDRNVPRYEPSEEEEDDAALYREWQAAKAKYPHLSYQTFLQKWNEEHYGPNYPFDDTMPGPEDPRWSRNR